MDKINDYLNNLTKLDEHIASIIKFISDIKCTEPLLYDVTCMLMNNLIEKIIQCSEI